MFQPHKVMFQLPWVQSEEPWNSHVSGQLISGYHPCLSYTSVVLSLLPFIPVPDSSVIFHILAIGVISSQHLPSWQASGSCTVVSRSSCQNVSHPFSNWWLHSCRWLLGLLVCWLMLSYFLHWVLSWVPAFPSLIFLLYLDLHTGTIPRYLYVSVWSRHWTTLLSFSGIPSPVIFLPFLSVALACLSSLNSTLMSSDTIFTVLTSPFSSFYCFHTAWVHLHRTDN